MNNLTNDQLVKFWVSADEQSEMGYWSSTTPDGEIIAYLVTHCGSDEERAAILAGSIHTSPAQEWMTIAS